MEAAVNWGVPSFTVGGPKGEGSLDLKDVVAGHLHNMSAYNFWGFSFQLFKSLLVPAWWGSRLGPQPAAPGSHVGVGLSPICSTSDLTPC